MTAEPNAAEPNDVVWSLDEGEGPALPLADQRAAEMIEAALAASESHAAPVAPSSAATPTSRPAGRRRWAWLAVAATLLVTSAVAAAVGAYYGARDAVREGWVEPEARERARTSDRNPSAPGHEAPGHEAPGHEAPAQNGAAHDDRGPDEAVRSSSYAVESSVAPDSERPMESRPRQTQTAHDLLLIANRQRAGQRWADAAATYERITRGHPRSEEAYVASVALGSLRLEHLGRPTAARRAFQRALRTRPRGPLSEEARYGIASSYRRRGTPEREADALRDYLEAHPSGMRAAAARARLADLATDR